MRGRAGGIASTDLAVRSRSRRDQMNDAAEVRGSFQKTAPRKSAEHTVKHHYDGDGS